MVSAYAPNGSRIVGILEQIPCSAGVTFTRTADGTVEHSYDSSGSTLFWDDQKPVREKGELVFLDENGERCLKTQLRFSDEDEDEDLRSEAA